MLKIRQRRRVSSVRHVEFRIYFPPLASTSLNHGNVTIIPPSGWIEVFYSEARLIDFDMAVRTPGTRLVPREYFANELCSPDVRFNGRHALWWRRNLNTLKMFGDSHTGHDLWRGGCVGSDLHDGTICQQSPSTVLRTGRSVSPWIRLMSQNRGRPLFRNV